MRRLFPQVLESEAGMVEALEAQGPQSDPLDEELRLAQIDLHKHPIWSPEYAEGSKRVTKLQARLGRKRSRIEPPAPGLPPGPVLSPAPPPPPPTAEEVLASIDSVPAAAGRYRVTERCILPGHEYNITGTCTQNPEAKDANDRNLIRKGTKEPILLISALAQSDLNSPMQVRAYFAIFGGGMLAVFCLTFLLLRFGQF